MSADMLEFYRGKLKRMGRWMFARYMRNRGVAFEHTYYVIFGRPPRIV